MKRFLCALSAFALACGLCTPFSTTQAVDVEALAPAPLREIQIAQSLASQDEALDYYLAQADNDSYGGVFYDDDGTLVVAVVETAPCAPALLAQDLSDIDVEYRPVKRSLRHLEEIKDFLADYMAPYSILALDADEVKNEVSIAVRDHSEANRAAIQALVDSAFPDVDYLRFEDFSKIEIRTTVGRPAP